MMSEDERLTTEVATLASGCFWCTEAVFAAVKGVHHVESGYIGGHSEDPDYQQVCSGTTGHAEAVRVAFDPTIIPYRVILEIFFGTHDPTTLNQQGGDIGTQYRSAIYYHSAQQRQTAEELMAELDARGVFSSPIITEVTEVAEAGVFYPAEEYHQDYFERNPQQGYCQAVINPKLAKFRAGFADRLKSDE